MAEDHGLLLFDHGIPDSYLDCQTSSYSRMLRGLNLDPRVLGDQWWYTYKQEPSPDWPLDTFSFVHHEYRETIRDWYGVSEQVISHPNPRQAIERIRSAVTGGLMITVCVDIYHYAKANFFYRKSHYPRRVVISDSRDGQLLVLDGLGEGRFTGWMPEVELIPAIDSGELERGSWGFNARNTTIEIPPPARTTGCPSSGQVRDRLLEMAPHFLAAGDDDDSMVIGWRAARAFADDLPERTAALASSSSDVALRISNTLGGIASQRRLNVMFLELAASKSPDFDDAISHFRKAAREWYKIFTIFLFGMRLGRDPAAIANELTKRIELLIESERAGTTAILSMLADMKACYMKSEA